MKSSRDAAALGLKVIGDAVNLRWFGTMFVNWTTIVVCMMIAALFDQMFIYALAVFVIGTRQHAIAILAHDGAHRHASRFRWLNDGATCLFGFWPLGIGLHGYRKFHFAHHQHLGHDGDPELRHKRRFADKWQPDASPLRLFLTDILGFAWREVMFAISLMRPARAIDIVGPVALIGSMVLLAVLGGVAELIIVWYLALYTSFWAVFRMRAYTEHVGTSGTHRLAEPAWWKKLIYLPANTWLHWEHHKWPGIPSWQLAHMARGKIGEVKECDHLQNEVVGASNQQTGSDDGAGPTTIPSEQARR